MIIEPRYIYIYIYIYMYVCVCAVSPIDTNFLLSCFFLNLKKRDFMIDSGTFYNQNGHYHFVVYTGKKTTTLIV